MNEFQNTNIQVAEIEAKMSSTGNMKYTLTGTDKKKYFFYQKNKGKDCDVFESFNNMQVKKGTLIAIGFTEEQKSFVNQKGETIKYTDRFIGSMREASDLPVTKSMNTYDLTGTGREFENTPLPDEYPSLATPISYSIPKGQDQFGRRLALHGYQNARLINHTIEQVKQETQALLELEDWTNEMLSKS